MFCPQCGKENDDNNYRCVGCGNVLHPAAPPRFQPQPPLEADPVTRLLIPVGRSPWAIAALNQINASQGQMEGRGFAVAGIATSASWLGLYVIVVIIAVIAAATGA